MYKQKVRRRQVSERVELIRQIELTPTRFEANEDDEDEEDGSLLSKKNM